MDSLGYKEGKIDLPSGTKGVAPDHTNVDTKIVNLADATDPEIIQKHIFYSAADTPEKKEYIQALLRRHEAAEAKAYHEMEKSNPTIAEYFKENNNAIMSGGKPIEYPKSAPEQSTGFYRMRGNPLLGVPEQYVSGHFSNKVLTDVDFDNLFIKNYFPEVTKPIRQHRTISSGEIPTMVEAAGEKVLPLSQNYSNKIMPKLRKLKGEELNHNEMPGLYGFNVTGSPEAYAPFIPDMKALGMIP